MLHPHMQVLTAHGFIPVAQLHHHRVANIDPNSGHLVGYSRCTSEQFPYNGDLILRFLFIRIQPKTETI